MTLCIVRALVVYVLYKKNRCWFPADSEVCQRSYYLLVVCVRAYDNLYLIDSFVRVTAGL
jgi:hypothetical protein